VSVPAAAFVAIAATGSEVNSANVFSLVETTTFLLTLSNAVIFHYRVSELMRLRDFRVNWERGGSKR
jgi:alcohol dehydrogenase YqhD (iron-dependent ADH family)